jgi:hypothetical protein
MTGNDPGEAVRLSLEAQAAELWRAMLQRSTIYVGMI